VRRAEADGIDLEVYYDSHHSVNVDRIISALEASLTYYRANFGPYQFPYARIVEFPGYATYAQAFGGMIAYSEKLGFTMDVRNPDTIDFVTYVTAHEIAHQYWGHQLVGADVQGATFLSETLSQYSALMVMRQLYGDAHIQRFLKFELNRYLTGRRGDKVEELPLTRVEDQAYIHYNKGSLAMYLLQDRLGEDRINTMLKAMLAKYRFKGAPYARSKDLLAGLLSLARTSDERELVLDLIDRITLYDFKVSEASVRTLPNGQFETTLTVNAGKYYADGAGVEPAAPLQDSIDIGIFLKRPGTAGFSQKDVIRLERFKINSGEQTIRIVSAQRPLFVGIDPYIKYVDRNGDDNVIAVTVEASSGS
jgi:aminopeptidase N